uniref:Uncharacterized protein n=1 Tax=Siphoviridae sp. ctyg07 TaxID=2825747 RepID=A0A8S5VCE6_9CAUD|nr:MAG TPA: hypothetical protein [Siphoviridae sp. ctyg07]DAI20943.1 MAG TPA: hypothetical protein [Caudoviricetes sp.]
MGRVRQPVPEGCRLTRAVHDRGVYPPHAHRVREGLLPEGELRR